MSDLLHRSIGAAVSRRDGRLKVTGQAAYAFEQEVERPLYLHPLQATVGRGAIRTIDSSEAEATEGRRGPYPRKRAAASVRRRPGALYPPGPGSLLPRPVDRGGDRRQFRGSARGGGARARLL